MTDILGLVSYEQVRSVLTVATADLPDSVLSSYGIQDDIEVDLSEWLPAYGDITDDTQLALLRMYIKYFCAGTVAITAQNFILTKRSDGSNEGQRSDEGGFKELSMTLLSKAQSCKNKLLTLLEPSTSSSSFSLVGVSSPSRDVITEPRS